MNRNLKLLFTVSVLMNVLLLGVSGGMVVKRHHGPHAWMEEAQKGMSPEARTLMAREFQEAHKQIGPLGQDARAARQDIVKALSSPEFSEAEFDAAIEALRKAQQGIMTEKMEATKRIAGELPQAERAKLAEHFAKSYSNKWNRDPGKHDFPPPPASPEGKQQP